MTVTSTSHTESAGARSGGQILLDALRANGTDRVFSVPGESCLPFLEAMRVNPEVDLVVCRHEASASHMAEADGKLTGSPGILLVSRGPGAMHAAVGIHMAYQNSTPMIVLVGQVPREFRGREAFQEMNYTSIFADTTKWAVEITEARQIPEIVGRAFQMALSGRPGPVVIAIPEDVFDETCTESALAAFRPQSAAPSAESMAAVQDMLARAERPMVIVGGPGWTPQSARDVLTFAERFDLPVIAGFRHQTIVDNRHRCYGGHLAPGIDPKLKERIRNSDLLIVIGERLGEPSTQSFTLLDIPVPQMTMVHVHPSAEELGRIYRAALPVHCGVAAFSAAAAALMPPNHLPWSDWRSQVREDYLRFRSPPTPSDAAAVHLPTVVAQLRDALPDDAVVTNGAGNYTGWVHRFFEFRDFGTQFAPQGGSMGYGFPAALAAQLRHPDRTVVAFAGDGCFLMASPEMATAVQRRLPVIVIIVNNGMYGAIRAHQERAFPGRPVGTELHNPDFADFSRSFGGFGAVVSKTEEFLPALQQARASNGPAIIELRVDPEELSPGVTVAALRKAKAAH
jgi:acetolactate synthase I/II/III large subunit